MRDFGKLGKRNKQGGFWTAIIPFLTAAAPYAATAAGLYTANRANQASRGMANAQMAFQDEMSRTAHQRQVADMRLAGLNPILSAGGGGASTPSGAMAMQQDVGANLMSNFSSAKLIKEQARKLRYEADTAEWVKDRAQALAGIERNNWNISDLNRDVVDKRFVGDMDAARFWSSEAYSKYRRYELGTEAVRRGLGAINPLRGLFNFGGSKPGLKRR